MMDTEELPPCTLENLSVIVDEFTTGDLIHKRRHLVHKLLDNKVRAPFTNSAQGAYLKELANLFHQVDELQDANKLFDTFNLYKSLIQMGESSLMELMLSEDLYEATFGALEYDPDLLDSPKDPSSEPMAKFSPTEEDPDAQPEGEGSMPADEEAKE